MRMNRPWDATVRSVLAGMLMTLVLLSAPGASAAASKYYFELHKIESTVPVDPDLRAFAG